MAVADDLEQTRAALQMINPAPFNAEAPPEALAGDITPTELHYVRSNFAVPTHDGTLEIGGAVESSTTLTLDDTAGGRRAMGRLRGFDRPLDGRAPARGAGPGAPGGGGRRGSVRGRRPRQLSPPTRPSG